MTDRELLELAAKAVGLKHVDYTGVDYDGRLGIVLVDDIGRHCGEFSPLTDDGDALRLAVKLGFIVEPGKCWHSSYGPAFGEDVLDGVMTATRRAIVRAAAEIGKGMK